MSADAFIRLIEELVDLKVQQHIELHTRANPAVARLIGSKRETDRRRLEQIRADLQQLLTR